MSQAVVNTGFKPVEIATGDYREINSHKNPYNGSVWAELRHAKDAMNISRGGSHPLRVVLRELRPESRNPAPIFTWRHSVLPVADYQQFTLGQIETLRRRYAAEGIAQKDAQTRQIWVDNAGLDLLEFHFSGTVKGITGSNLGEHLSRLTNNSRSPRHNLGVYGIHAARTLYQNGLLEPDFPEETYRDFVSLLKSYDALRDQRDKLEDQMEAIANRGLARRVFWLGCSAVRSVYRVVAWPVRQPTLWLYSRAARLNTPEPAQVRRAHKLAAIASLAAFSLVLWTSARRGLDPAGADVLTVPGLDSALPDSKPTVDPNPQPTPGEVPPTPERPDGSPTGNPDPPEAVFSSDALTTSDGEGWIQQFDQMGLHYDQAFMDNGAGAWLERMGYAYLDYDPSAGTYDWRMNHTNISPRVLGELYDRAAQAGLAK